MKSYQILLIIAILVGTLVGCKKDKPAVSPKLYLVNQVITEFVQLHQKDTVKYLYDSNNRLIGYGPVYKGKYERQFVFTYDSNNRIVQTDNYNITNDTLLSTIKYAYTSDGFVEIYTSPNGENWQTTFTLNNKQQVAKFSTSSYYMLFDYDTRGNLVHAKGYPQPGRPDVNEEYSYSYDSYKNPFYAQKNNYIFMFLVIPHINTCINNLQAGMTYQYNGDGYPVTALGHSDLYGDVNTYYGYTVK